MAEKGVLSPMVSLIVMLAAVMATTATGTLWLTSQLDIVEASIEEIDERLDIIELVKVVDRWTAADEILFALALEGANTRIGLEVPDPAAIVRDRMIRNGRREWP